MSAQVDFYYDFGSPASYLAYKHLPIVASRSGATVALRPILLGGIFKATGNRSPIDVEAKGRWMWKDLERFAKRYGAPFRVNPHFPIVTLHLMRGAYAVSFEDLRRYSDAMFQAIWAEGLDMNDPKVVAKALADAGFDAAQIFSAVQSDGVKDTLKQETDDAVARGVFGAPTFFVGGDVLRSRPPRLRGGGAVAPVSV